MSESTAARDYRSTLNLPKTGFAMKANLAQAEPQTLKSWFESGQFDAIMAARAGSEPFVFHDGPPYANGNIHVGHMLNKVLKDLVVRSRVLEDRLVHYVPGWDCHGLPIEHKVLTEIVKGGKAEKLDTLAPEVRRMAIRRECAAYAEKFIKLQGGEMQRLLTLADYAHPYFTMQPGYEAATLEVFAGMMEQGVVFRDLKPVHWSIANKTALAEAELEYEERKDLSVYVDFEFADTDAVAQAFGCEIDQTPCLMIWTTTPWTLPANLAIACHPRYRYALVEHDGALSVVAAELWPKVAATIKAAKVRVLAECEGAALVGLSYRHPFCDRVSRVVAAEYVTLEDGTGLVHTAPGHGAEDYRTGLKEGLPVYCPVCDDGTYDDSVPEWLRGMSVWDANAKVTDHLRQSGHLVFDHEFTHSYPHDWRSKTPVIFRATEQWFIGVDRPMKRDGRTLRAAALHAVEERVQFVPEWGRNRMRGMLTNRPDWCISRQRVWGLPIPAFLKPDGSAFMTPASVRAVAAVFAAKGSDAWFQLPVQELLAGYDAARDPDAPSGLEISTLTKGGDIFDVWFEAGSSWNSVMRARGLGYPSELYLEGSDQHRGWFQLSLLPAIAVTGEPPFRTLLTHGFMVDKDGLKMSKSLGNALDVAALLKDYGADIARWWVSSVPYDSDIKIDLEYFRLAGESYRKVRNTIRFLLSNLEGCSSVERVAVAPESIDGWALAELAALQSTVRRAYSEYDFRAAHVAIFDFCNDTLSAMYCAATKDRLYCDAHDSARRRRTQQVMHDTARVLCQLLAPIMPHTADEAWSALHQGAPPSSVMATVHLDLGHPVRHPAWATAFTLRERVLKSLEETKATGLENPLDAGIGVGSAIESLLPGALAALAAVEPDLADLWGVSRVSIGGGAGAGAAIAAGGSDGVTVFDLRSEPRCDRSWHRDLTVRQRSDGGMLSDRDAAAVGVA